LHALRHSFGQACPLSVEADMRLSERTPLLTPSRTLHLPIWWSGGGGTDTAAEAVPDSLIRYAAGS